MKYLLGIDLGSSSVKVALVDAASGCCVSAASFPGDEAPIKALQLGWAEQQPDDWWLYFKKAFARSMQQCGASGNDILSIGISYQMHGLVCLDKEMQPLRDAIIWCDSRGVPYGEKAFHEIGEEDCLQHLLNSPGNFTAAKLAWVKENEPELYDKIRYVMLPGDYMALRLTGSPATTACGLSEMMLYDYRTEKGSLYGRLMDYFGFTSDIVSPLVPTFGDQGRVLASVADELGIMAGIPVSYRAGDQPNNALSLAVLNPGEVAATAGTSGVVYGVTDTVNYDKHSRINTFLHVNHHLGVMHCVNGCGIQNAWMRRLVAGDATYDELNRMAANIPIGSEGVCVIPFGNGAERVLENREVGASIHGLNFNLHHRSHLLRAAQEGIAFAMYYGMEVMQELGMKLDRIHAGKANMFLSPLFREILSSVSGACIELYDTDGAVGAARGAGMGSGVYGSAEEAFKGLQCLGVTEPNAAFVRQYREAYCRWKDILENEMYGKQS